MNHNKYVILLSLLTALLLALPASAYDYDFMLGGLCYNMNSDGTSVTVTYEYSSSSPRYSSLSGALTIPSSVYYSGNTYSVTSIGRSAFYGCSGLTSVTIPNSVTSIGDRAFENCSGLTSVTIPNSVTSIGYWAFSSCSGLTSVTIGNSVTSIGYEAFSGCSGLTGVYISDLAKWCAITFSNYDANPLYYAHHLYLNGSEVKNLTIPNSVVSIGNYAFYGCRGLTSVTIPNSVSSIGYEAFRGCSGLTSVTLGNSVTLIGGYAFLGCSGLTSVTIPNSVSSIGISAFYGCSGLTSVTIPNSVTSIGNWAFGYCSGLTSVTIPNSVTSIGDCAFSGCSGLTSVTWNAKSCDDFSKSNYAPFAGLTNIKTFEFGNEVEKIPAYICYGLSGLTSVTIPNSVTSIGDYAFYGCSGLTSVTIPNSVTSIGNYAFGNCSGVTSILVSPGNTSYDSRDNCNAIIETSTNTLIAGCKSTIIPNSVTSIGNYAFYGCSGLTSVTIPNSVSSIGVRAFYKCSGLTSVTIPNSVTSIGNYAFYGCSGLTSVTIPNSVTSIGEWAFLNCSGLSDITALIESPELVKYGGNVFNGVNKSSCILHVPESSLEKYKSCSPWNAFTNINPITHYLSAGVLEHLRGDDEAVVALPIMLDNKTGVAQLQFDFTLPEGVTIVGEYNASTGVTYYDDCIHLDNDRKTRSHYATINHLEGSTYRALISTSQSNIALKGNHGTVANLMLHLAQYHEAGDYSILFSNIVMSGTDVNDQHTAVNYNSLVRFHYVLGDANADVDVDVADYQATARVILNLSTPRFYADAANVYNDYSINVSDLQGIVNIMAGIDTAVIKHAPKEPLPATALALVPRVLGDGRIAIALTGDVPIGALQMDLTLPHGVTLEQAVMASRNATHRVDYAALDDGTVRLIVGSPARATLEPDDEAFLVLTLAGASGGTATLGDALAVETDLTTHRLADVAFDITPTGVNDPTADRPRIYVENNLLVIESPTGGAAQLVRVNGISSPLSVTAGRNEYTLDQGIYIVRMGNTTAKIMIKP